MSNDIRNVSNPDYSLLTLRDFFGGTDSIRIIIIIYIFLSLIIKAIIFFVIGISIKRQQKFKLPLGTWVILGILFMNFIHTFSYFFEWVIKEDVGLAYAEKDGKDIEVGGLLVGNPNHLFGCYTQAFLLIFSSLSQDFLINIFFFLVNLSAGESEKMQIYAKYAIIILGILFPFIFTLILGVSGALGLNDEFCYVTKFRININTGIAEYEYFEYFQTCVNIIYLIRIVNFIATVYFLRKIWIYVKQQNMEKTYLFKSIMIPIIQLSTIGIGVIYRLINFWWPKLSVMLAKPYLILNTFDGVLFPIGFAILNDIFIQLKKIITGQDIVRGDTEDNYESIEFTDRKPEENIDE